MSLDTFYFPSLKFIKDENPSLYFGLLAFIRELPNGPWRFSEGYDPTTDGTSYTINLKSLGPPYQILSVRAEKNGGAFSFSVSAGPEQ